MTGSPCWPPPADLAVRALPIEMSLTRATVDPGTVTIIVATGLDSIGVAADTELEPLPPTPGYCEPANSSRPPAPAAGSAPWIDGEFAVTARYRIRRRISRYDGDQQASRGATAFQRVSKPSADSAPLRTER
jgi:hypothetical protein